MAENEETRVFYKAIADFAAVQRELREYRRELERTKAAEEAFNASSTKGQAASAKAATQRTKAVTDALRDEKNVTEEVVESRERLIETTRREVQERRKATQGNVRFVESVGQVDRATGEVIDSTDKATASTSRWSAIMDRARETMARLTAETDRSSRAHEALRRAQLRQQEAAESVTIAEHALARAQERYGSTSSQAVRAQIRLDRARRDSEVSTNRATAALRRFREESSLVGRAQDSLERGTNSLFRSFQRFGNWRPRLTPPFVALVPIIGAVIAAINPLISMLGAVGAAAIGLAGNIGSLSGAFLALPGILSGVVAGLGSVIASFGGVGAVFKAYGAMQKATNSAAGGSTGPTQAERAEDLARAEWNLAKAQRNVQKAQENLNEARREALQDLIDLREEVSRASLNEERAVANLRLAQEEYWNVLADPGSTLGDKLDAAADLKEAEQDLEDVRKQNVENAKKLAEAEKKGVDQSEKVLDAQENLTDALWAQRDAERAVKGTVEGTTAAHSAAVTATNEFNDALAKLSPSARAFALAIIAMEDEWNNFKRTIQEEFFSQFVDDLNLLPRALANIESFLRPAAREMGRFTSAALQLFTSPEWTRDMATIGEQNGDVISNLGDAALSLANGLKDITIAAGPFTEWLTGSLAEGADNFERMVSVAREDGSLAEWLDKVAGRLERWWTIVKNIGGTIFNYSAAASEFGDWITEGLLNSSEGWLASSQEAREEGSGFQEYLENIKPLLSEMKGLFGDFFGWLREEMMDPENIEGATRLLKLIREDFGPAIARLLDTMAELEIDEKFIEAMTAIADAVNRIMELGGDALFETFFDVIVGFFESLADFLESLPDGWAEDFGRFVGALAAASFIGKFTGITNLLGALTAFLGSSLFTKFGSFVGGLLGLKDLKLPAWLGGSLGGKGAGAGAGAAAGAAGAAAKGGWFGKLLGGLGKGGIPGLILGTAGSLAGDAISGSAVEGGAGAGQRIGGGMLSGAANGAGWGATIGAGIGSIVPGVGTAIGGVAGGAIGGVAGAVGGFTGASDEDKEAFFEDLSRNWDSFLDGIGSWWNDNVVTPFKTAATNVQNWWNDNVVEPFETVANNVENWWNDNVVIPFQTTATNVGNWWNENVVQPFQRLGATIGEIWDLYVVQPFKTAATNVANWWNDNVVTPFKTAATNVANWWNDNVVTPFKTAATNVANWWNNNVVTPFKNAATNVANWWNNSVVTPFKNAATNVANWWNSSVVTPFKTAATNVQNWWNNSVVTPFKNAATNVANWWNNNVVAPFKAAIDNFKSGWNSFWGKFQNFNPIDAINSGLRSWFGLDSGGERRFGDVPASKRGGSTLNRVKDALRGNDRLNITSTYRTPAQNRAAGGSATSLHMDRNNPAVDIAGPISAMNAMAVKLANIGGWRQLYYNNIRYPGVAHWPGHSDHIHVANTGGRVPGHGNGDIIPSMLTPGEFVIRKEIVNRVGADNIARLNSGVMSFTDLLMRAQQNAAASSVGGQDIGALLAGTGLGGMSPLAASPAAAVNSGSPGMTLDNRVIVEKMEIINPIPETASESLPNAIRKAGYMNSARTR